MAGKKYYLAGNKFGAGKRWRDGEFYLPAYFFGRGKGITPWNPLIFSTVRMELVKPWPPNLRNEVFDAPQHDALGVKVDPAPHRVDDRLGLLKDLLLHERGVVSLQEEHMVKVSLNKPAQKWIMPPRGRLIFMICTVQSESNFSML